MEFNSFMKSKRGQISIEFMLIVLISLVYLQLLMGTVINPSIDAVEDSTRLGQARISAEKLSSTINEISSTMGEGKKTINVYVPKDSILMCTESSNTIEFTVTLYGSETTACGLTNPPTNPDNDNPPDPTKCTKVFLLNVTSNFTCDGFPLDATVPDPVTGNKKGLFKSITVEKKYVDPIFEINVELN